VSLKPKKGTQGREMHQKIKIVSALILALTLVVGASAPTTALAGGPLLSGYGGPGAGEQAILGSTLVGGGGTGSGGSSGGPTGDGRGGGGTASPTGATGGSSAAGTGVAKAGTTGSRAGEVPNPRGHKRPGGSAAGQVGRAHVSPPGASAYVYPTTLRAASYSSPTLGISGGDLLALVVTIATLALLGVLTIRMRRLQA
jgi:hypothetical protein